MTGTGINMFLEDNDEKIQVLSSTYKLPSQIQLVEILKGLIRKEEFNNFAEVWVRIFDKYKKVLPLETYSDFIKLRGFLLKKEYNSRIGHGPELTEIEHEFMASNLSFNLELEENGMWSGEMYDGILAFVQYSTIPDNIFINISYSSTDSEVMINLYPPFTSSRELKRFIDKNWPAIKNELKTLSLPERAYTKRKLTPYFKRDIEIYKLHVAGKSNKEILKKYGNLLGEDPDLLLKIIRKEQNLHM